MTINEHKNARALFEASLRSWGGPETFVLDEADPLPDAEMTWWKLHPYEVEMFGIDPDLHPRLVEAYSWYSGAIAQVAHNDYYEFATCERGVWHRFVHVHEGEPTFDRTSCIRFMHEAADLPLRQCAAMMTKMDACELRGATVWFRDEIAEGAYEGSAAVSAP